MKKITGIPFIWITMMLFTITAKSQTPQQALDSIYERYDSLPNLSFDVRYTLTSDTVYGNFVYDVLEGKYTLNRRKAIFRLGDIEYMQNDSFFIAVYKKDELMIVTDPKKANSGSYLPMREQIDSMLALYSDDYAISVTTVDSVGRIIFERKPDSIAQFKTYTIEYDTASKYLRSVSFVFEEHTPVSETNTMDVIRTRKLKLEFLNYRFDFFGNEMYDEENYFYKEQDEYKPTATYANFRIFNSRSNIPKGDVE